MNFDQFVGKEETSLSVGQLIRKYLFHWPVFVLSFIVCLLASYFYLRYTPKSYSVSSVLMIKDEKGSRSDSGGELMNSFDIFGGSKVVDNELEILKSRTIMTEVVNRLNLMVNFSKEGRIIDPDIYDVKPVDIKILRFDPNLAGKKFTISFPDPLRFILKQEGGEGIEIKGNLDSTMRFGIAIFSVVKRPEFFDLNSKGVYVAFSDPESIVGENLKKLEIQLKGKQSSVLELTIEDIVPQRGKDILNSLMQIYGETSLEEKNKTTRSTMEFIDDRLKLISGELTLVEKEVEGFKSMRGITTMSSDADMFLGNVKSNDDKLNEVNLKLSVIRDIQRFVDQDSTSTRLPSTLGIDDPTLLGQISKLSELKLSYQQLASTTGKNNAILKTLEAQIGSTKNTINSAINNIFTSYSNTRNSLLENESEILGSIKKLPSQERQLISIERQKSIKEGLYLYLLQKKEEAALSFAASVTDSRIVDAAISSRSPIKPNSQTIILGAFLIGLILPIGYVYSKELLNNKIETTKDIKSITNTPILGEIMYEENSAAIVVQSSSRKAIAEQIRSIRTNLQFLRGTNSHKKGNVTLFTSSMSGEGKSFVATNLAAALAISGKKTVLIELDLRKPKISKYLGLPNKLGISNYLIGKAESKDIITQESFHKNLFVIGSGPIPPNPSELLVQSKIEELIEELRQNFDEIIIDTPPVGLVTDAQILAKLADSSIYIVRQKHTYKDQIKQVELLYQGSKFPRLNVVLNGITLGSNSTYGYGYGYGYGYYTEDVKNKNLTLKSFLRNIIKRF